MKILCDEPEPLRNKTKSNLWKEGEHNQEYLREWILRVLDQVKGYTILV